MIAKRSIIVPAYAEEVFIGGTLRSLHNYLTEKSWLDSTEVIVVTADAADNTIQITAQALAKFPHAKHIKPGARVGKGRDVKAGLAAASSERVLFMDADLATPLRHVAPMFAMLDKKRGMVIGVRDLTTMHNTWWRRLSSTLSNKLVRALVGWDITDSQCGFKAFDQHALTTILPRSKIQGWGFDFEFIAIAKAHKIPITSMAIPDWHDPKPEGKGLAGDSQLRAMWQTLAELMKVKWNKIKGDYR